MKNINIDKLINSWYNSLANQISSYSRPTYSSSVNTFRLYLGTTSLLEVTPEIVNSFLTSEKYAQSTIRQYKVGLSNFYNYLVDQGYCNFNPVKKTILHTKPRQVCSNSGTNIPDISPVQSKFSNDQIKMIEMLANSNNSESNRVLGMYVKTVLASS